MLREVAARAAAGCGAATLYVAGVFMPAPWAAADAGLASEASVEITSPEDGQRAAVAEALNVTGQAAMPNDAPTATNVYFLVDASLVNELADACGEADSRPGCSLEGVATMNDALGDAVVDVSVIAFSEGSLGATGAVAADVSPEAGDQPFTTPSADEDDDAVSDIDEVLDGTSYTGFEDFTSKSIGPSVFADFDAALVELARLIGLQPAGERNLAFLLSPGDFALSEETATASSDARFSREMRAAASPEGRAQAAAAAVDGGLDSVVGKVTISTFGLSSGGPFFVQCEGSLGDIADATGGSCLEDPTEAEYIAAIANSDISVVETFTVTVNGDEVDSELAPDGAFSATVPAGTLEEGENTIMAKAVIQVVSASEPAASAAGRQATAQGVDAVEASDTVTVIGTVPGQPRPTDGAPAPTDSGGPAPTDNGGTRPRSHNRPELPDTGSQAWRTAMLGVAMVLAGTALVRVPRVRPLAVASPAGAIPLAIPLAAPPVPRPAASPTRTRRRVGMIAAATVVITAMVVADRRSNRSR